MGHESRTLTHRDGGAVSPELPLAKARHLFPDADAFFKLREY
jgi:hypothetical protein